MLHAAVGGLAGYRVYGSPQQQHTCACALRHSTGLVSGLYSWQSRGCPAASDAKPLVMMVGTTGKSVAKPGVVAGRGHSSKRVACARELHPGGLPENPFARCIICVK